MHFELSPERQLLKETIARFLRDEYGIDRRPELTAEPRAFNRDMWTELAELGLIGALLPENAGGFGGNGEDIAVVMEALGRGLVTEPFLGCAILGGGAVAETKPQHRLLEEVIAGRTLLAFAHGEPASGYATSTISTSAKPVDGGWVLNGQKAVVFDGDIADALIVSARIAGQADEEGGIGLFLVDAETAGVERRGYGTIDSGGAADIRLDHVRVGVDDVLGVPGDAYPVIERVIGRGVLALCAEALGLMEACKDITLDYVRTREQFGVPIGKFQALQHRLVDLCLEIEQFRSAVILATARIDDRRETREQALAAAKHLAGRVGRQVAEESIQLHGGIGTTWECAVSHYAKRLIMIDHRLGDTDHHLERFIAFSTRSRGQRP